MNESVGNATEAVFEVVSHEFGRRLADAKDDFLFYIIGPILVALCKQLPLFFSILIDFVAEEVDEALSVVAEFR